ncbi:frizzled-3-like [Zonotrichia leucophrys gambelii]|uniref:frizzled-3-like n=1 Tax=Zonotrichia leucophrys gambelii TaxID=257770 RepID=UPI00314097B5
MPGSVRMRRAVWGVRKALAWLLPALWALGWRVPAGAGHSLFSCEPIALRMCQDLPYNATFMPNLLNHYDQHTAALAMETPPLSPAGIGPDSQFLRLALD